MLAFGDSDSQLGHLRSIIRLPGSDATPATRLPAVRILLHSISERATVRSVTESSIHPKPLTELQQAILDFIWSKGTATAEQVREGIAGKHPLKESSVRTLLGRLEARGLLGHSLEGKTFIYRATAAPRSMAARAVRSVIERFCAGSVEQFLTGMVDEKVLSVEQLERLTRKVRNQK
jgi:BlaI family transcriptional regulator, penicillinase repressor